MAVKSERLINPIIPESRLKLHIFGWLADHHGCGFYRVKMPLMALKKLGYQITLDTRSYASPVDFSSIAKNFTNTKQYLNEIMPGNMPRPQFKVPAPDVLVGQRVSNPGPTKMWQSLANRSIGTRPLLVFEVDDDLLNIDPSNKRAWEVYRKADVRARFLDNLRAADKVTVSTPYLADEYKQYNPNTFAVPNTIPQSLIDAPSNARTDGKITVGWAGSPTHQMDWDEVSGSIGMVLRETRNVEMHMVGWDYTSSLKLPTEKMRVTSWIDGTPNYWRAIDFHIGLAPIKDHKFNWSKSHIKALEYNAMGIPVIASNVGPYKDFVKHGKTGFLADNNDDWINYLKLLIKDHNLREEMSANAKEWATQWTIERWSFAWENTLTTF